MDTKKNKTVQIPLDKKKDYEEAFNKIKRDLQNPEIKEYLDFCLIMVSLFTEQAINAGYFQSFLSNCKFTKLQTVLMSMALHNLKKCPDSEVSEIKFKDESSD